MLIFVKEEEKQQVQNQINQTIKMLHEKPISSVVVLE